MKMIILTAAWRRHKLFQVFCNWSEWVRSQIDCDFVSVCSEAETAQIAINSQHLVIEHKNLPLSNKWNHGIKTIKAINHDAVLVLGSDDFPSITLLKKYVQGIKRGVSLQGTLDCFIYDRPSNKMAYWPGYGLTNKKRAGEPIGAAMCFSKRLCSSLNYEFWPKDITRNMDGLLQIKLKTVKHSTEAEHNSKDGLICCKSETNLTPFGTISHMKTRDVKDIIESILPNHIGKQLLEL